MHNDYCRLRSMIWLVKFERDKERDLEKGMVGARKRTDPSRQTRSFKSLLEINETLVTILVRNHKISYNNYNKIYEIDNY